MASPVPSPPLVNAAAGVPSLRTLGTGAAEAAAGNDSRLTTPTGASLTPAAGKIPLADGAGKIDSGWIVGGGGGGGGGDVSSTRLISAGTGLTGGGDLSADRTISMPAVGPGAGTVGGGSSIVQSVTLDVQGRVSSVTVTPTSGFALSTLTISAGTGLTGGGDLTTNRTISMPSVGPGAATIGGGGTYVASVTLDAQGRVTAATAGTPSGGTTRRVAPDANDLAVFAFDEDPSATSLVSTGTEASGDFNSVTSANPGSIGIFASGLRVGAGGRVYNSANRFQPATNMTVSAWLRIEQYLTGSFGRTVFKSANAGAWSSPFSSFELLSFDASSNAYCVVNTSGGAGFVSVNRALIPLYEWVFVAVTYDGANVKLYMNGIVVNSVALTGTMTWNSNGEWMMGRPFGIASEEAIFSIDDLRISSVARSAAYILDQYQRGSGRT